MGYWANNKRYMHSLGLHVKSTPEWVITVNRIKGNKPRDHGYVSWSMYYWEWRKHYPQLKVSRSADDICHYCFVSANCHCYLANHSARASLLGGDNSDAIIPMSLIPLIHKMSNFQLIWSQNSWQQSQVNCMSNLLIRLGITVSLQTPTVVEMLIWIRFMGCGQVIVFAEPTVCHVLVYRRTTMNNSAL